jgi:general secretion pathway protein B
MSFILDALKKSETERQEQGPTEFANVPTSSESPGMPRWLWVLGLLLAVNLVVLLGLLLRDDTPEPAVPDVRPAPTASTVPEASSSFSSQLDEARKRRPAPEAQPVPRPEPVSALPEPEPVAARPAPAADAPEPRPPQPVAAARPDFTLRALPTVDELRANGTITIPELHLDIHVFSEAPADRFVFINMTRHRENSQLAEGPIVSEITPEGVILDYRGTVFLLPRE